MKLPVSLLVLSLCMGCDKASKEEPAQAKSEEASAKPPAPPPPPTPLVGAETLREVNAVNEKIKQSIPVTAKDTEDQRPDETTVDYRQRMRNTNRAVAKFNNEWRHCFVGRSEMGYVPASDMPLSKFVRDSKLTLKWECSVFDIQRGPSGGDQILCSTASPADWSFAVLGYLPKRHGLKKGSVVRFDRMNTCMPAEGSALKIKLLNMDDNNLRFVAVTADDTAVDAAASVSGTGATAVASPAARSATPKASPKVSLGDPVVTGVDKATVTSVALANLNQVRYCYEASLKRNPDLTGRVSVNLVISSGGPAVKSTAQEMSTPTPALEICIAGRVQTWAFPKPDGSDPANVTLPFAFR